MNKVWTALMRIGEHIGVILIIIGFFNPLYRNFYNVLILYILTAVILTLREHLKIIL